MLKFYSRVKKVEEKKRLKRAWKEGDIVCTEEENLGWFLLLEGSWEYLYVGIGEPEFKVGDEVSVIIKRKSE
jgi:hypothetical protein